MHQQMLSSLVDTNGVFLTANEALGSPFWSCGCRGHWHEGLYSTKPEDIAKQRRGAFYAGYCNKSCSVHFDDEHAGRRVEQRVLNLSLMLVETSQ